MRRFVTRSAWKQARKSRISRGQLVDASARANDGLVDAKLGAYLYKQHVGRRGDFRVILYHVRDRRSVVIHIFAKNVQPNLTGRELDALRDLVNVLNGLGDEDYAGTARERGWKDISDEEAEQDLQE